MKYIIIYFILGFITMNFTITDEILFKASKNKFDGYVMVCHITYWPLFLLIRIISSFL
jgi:hypothetical protein